MFLQETYEVQDCYRYDTSSNDRKSEYTPLITYRNSVTGSWNYNTTYGYYGNFSGGNGEVMVVIPEITGLNDFTIEFDATLRQYDNSQTAIVAYESNSTYSRLSASKSKSTLRESVNGTATESDSNHTNSFSLNTTVHYKYTITNNQIVLVITNGSTTVCSRTISYTPTNNTKFGFGLIWDSGWASNSYLKNIKVKAL